MWPVKQLGGFPRGMPTSTQMMLLRDDSLWLTSAMWAMDGHGLFGLWACLDILSMDILSKMIRLFVTGWYWMHCFPVKIATKDWTSHRWPLSCTGSHTLGFWSQSSSRLRGWACRFYIIMINNCIIKDNVLQSLHITSQFAWTITTTLCTHLKLGVHRCDIISTWCPHDIHIIPSELLDALPPLYRHYTLKTNHFTYHDEHHPLYLIKHITIKHLHRTSQLLDAYLDVHPSQ